MTQIEALKEFFRWAMRESWDGNDIDGGSIQEKAEKLGLIVNVPFDPEKHGEPSAMYDYIDFNPGDPWYVFAPGIAEDS